MKRLLLILLLCVILVATTFGLDLSLAPGLSVKNAFLYLILAAYMIQAAVYRNLSFELPNVMIPFGLLIGYCILSWFVAAFVVQPEYYEPFRTAISLKNERIDHFIVFLLFFYGVASTQEVLSLIRMFLWMMVISNLLTVIDGFNIPDLGIIQQREDGRLGGPMGESNQYGAFLALTLPAVIALLWDPKTKKMLAIIACLASVLAFLIASSRGSFVGIIVGSAFTVFFLRSFISLRQVAIGAAISIAAVTVVVVVFLSTDLFGDLVQRFAEKASGNAADVSSGRTVIWSLAIDRMLEHPLSFMTGFGWDAYDYMRGFRHNTHNSYLNILFNLGSPALLLYLVLVSNILATCRRALWRAEETARVFLTVFVFGFTSLSVSIAFVELYVPWIFIWAYVGLIMRLAVLSNRAGNMESGQKTAVSSLSTAA